MAYKTTYIFYLIHNFHESSLGVTSLGLQLGVFVLQAALLLELRSCVCWQIPEVSCVCRTEAPNFLWQGPSKFLEATKISLPHGPHAGPLITWHQTSSRPERVSLTPYCCHRALYNVMSLWSDCPSISTRFYWLETSHSFFLTQRGRMYKCMTHLLQH